MGKLLLDEGHTAAAEQWFRRSYDVLAATYGPESEGQFAYTYMYSGVIARQRGDYPSARSFLDRAVAAQLKGWPPEHVEVMKMRMHREYVECFADSARAARELGEVVAILERNVGPNHPISAQALGYLAVANAKLGRTALAHAQFEQAIERLGAKGAGSVQFREALQSYAEFAKERLAPADTLPILDRYAKLVTQRKPLKLE
jgi:tetratricopeptide (TPR) repeat protein